VVMCLGQDADLHMAQLMPGMLGLGLALRPENGGLGSSGLGLGLGLGSPGLGLGLDTKALALPFSRLRPGSHSATMRLLACH